MIVRKLRLQRGWSQQQLASFSGLSVRTIQRIERGQNAGLESLKALAAVFEVQLSALQQEPMTMNDPATLSTEEAKVLEQVRDLKSFYTHLSSYVLVCTVLAIVNVLVLSGPLWVHWVILGWGIGVLSHGLSVFEVFNSWGTNWEKRQIEKRLGRKL